MTLAPEPHADPDAPAPGRLPAGLADWEDVLALLVDPEQPRIADRARKRRLLSFLLRRARLDEERFWRLSRGERGRLFLSRYSRLSRDVPELELTSFDLDKLAKERFRREPLTLGAAWHYGFWRAYFSHAAITHPANDGLREEFSTAWEIARRRPAVLFRNSDGVRLEPVRSLRLDLPMLVGPLPFGDGHTIELAWLRAIERADPDADLKTRSLVIVPGDALLERAAAFRPHAAWILPRLEARHLGAFVRPPSGEVEALLAGLRAVELEWVEDLEETVATLLALRPDLLVSVHLRNDGRLLERAERAARTEGVAMLHVDAGAIGEASGCLRCG